jgi:hypothetical protein
MMPGWINGRRCAGRAGMMGLSDFGDGGPPRVVTAFAGEFPVPLMGLSEYEPFNDKF